MNFIYHANSIADIPYADFTDPGHNIPEIREMSTSIRVIVDHLRCAS